MFMSLLRNIMSSLKKNKKKTTKTKRTKQSNKPARYIGYLANLMEYNMTEQYVGNFGDVNPFEHGGYFVFEHDHEDCRSWTVIEVINDQDTNYRCFNPYQTSVCFFNVSEDEIEESVDEIISQYGCELKDISTDNKLNYPYLAFAVAQLGLVEPYEQSKFEKFTELAQHIYDEFPFDSLRDDLKFYIEMDDETDETIETYFEDFIDGCLNTMVEITGFPEIDRESLLDQITEEEFIMFDQILYQVEFEDLMYIANGLRGGFRSFGEDFMSCIFKHEEQSPYFKRSQYGDLSERLFEIASNYSLRKIEAVEVDYDYQITLTIVD
jgi:hypothetical protein